MSTIENGQAIAESSSQNKSETEPKRKKPLFVVDPLIAEKLGKQPVFNGWEVNAAMQSALKEPRYLKDPLIAVEVLNEAFSLHELILLNKSKLDPDEIKEVIDKTKKGIKDRIGAYFYISMVKRMITGGPKRNSNGNGHIDHGALSVGAQVEIRNAS